MSQKLPDHPLIREAVDSFRPLEERQGDLHHLDYREFIVGLIYPFLERYFREQFQYEIESKSP